MTFCHLNSFVLGFRTDFFLNVLNHHDHYHYHYTTASFDNPEDFPINYMRVTLYIWVRNKQVFRRIAAMT